MNEISFWVEFDYKKKEKKWNRCKRDFSVKLKCDHIDIHEFCATYTNEDYQCFEWKKNKNRIKLQYKKYNFWWKEISV